MTDQPYPDPPRPTLADLDPESATTDRLIAMVRGRRAGEDYPTAEVLLGNLPVASDATGFRSPARYLWAMLLARLLVSFLLVCPHCGAEMRIIAFITEAIGVTEAIDVRAILEQIGEPSTPPRIASARGPPEWEGDDSGASFLDEEEFTGDPLAQPEPEYAFDQRMTW